MLVFVGLAPTTKLNGSLPPRWSISPRQDPDLGNWLKPIVDTTKQMESVKRDFIGIKYLYKDRG